MSILPQLTIPKIVRNDLRGNLQYGKAPKWNWDTGDFDLNATGKITMLNDINVLTQWSERAWATARGRYRIFDFQYGSDLAQLIGMDQYYVQSRIENMIRDTINDSRITVSLVRDFIYNTDGSFQVTVDLIDNIGQQTTNLSVVIQ